MTRKLIAVLILVIFWLSLDYALVHAADMQLQTAGQSYADTTPFFKGSN